MARDAFHLSNTAISAYEDQKVSAIFRPLAQATLDRIDLVASDRILDVACGTGIVGREILTRVRPEEPITGLDLNPAMIDMARQMTQDDAQVFDWHVDSVEHMPFDDARFSLVICQQGAQFFPDLPAALAEMHRVTAPNGRLVLSIWDGTSDFFTTVADAVSRHISPELGARYLSPFTSDTAATLPGKIRSAGYARVETVPITVNRLMPDIAANITKELFGHPAGAEVEAAGPDTVAAISQDVISACSIYLSGKDMIAPQRANLYPARASG